MIVPECTSPEFYLIVTTINHLKFFFLFLELWLDCLEKKKWWASTPKIHDYQHLLFHLIMNSTFGSLS